MLKLFISTFLFFLVSCSSVTKVNEHKITDGSYEYAKFSSFHEGLFNFTYLLKEMDQDLKEKYLEEYISGYKVYWSLAKQLSFISADMTIKQDSSKNEPKDPVYKQILKLHTSINYEVQMHQIDIMNDEIALESFKYGVRMSRQFGFWEIFKEYFFEYCTNEKKKDQKYCDQRYASFLEEYQKTQEEVEPVVNSEI